MIFNLILLERLTSRSFSYFYLLSDFLYEFKLAIPIIICWHSIIRVCPFVSNRSRFTHQKIRTRIAANIWQVLLNNDNKKSIYCQIININYYININIYLLWPPKENLIYLHNTYIYYYMKTLKFHYQIVYFCFLDLLESHIFKEINLRFKNKKNEK